MNLFAVVLLGLAALVACQNAADVGVVLTPSDLTCTTSDQCRWVQQTCSYGCGTAANDAGATRISSELFKLCPNGGTMSDIFCPPSYPSCVDGKCALVREPGPIKVDPSLQTCTTKDDCAVFQPACNGGTCCLDKGLVSVSVANVATLDAMWKRTCAGTPQVDCSFVKCMQSPTDPTCVEGYCTLNGAKPIIVAPPPPPQCDPTLKTNEFCQCLSTNNVARWACPPTCPGVAPKGCYCSLNIEIAAATADIAPSTGLQYVCSIDACANVRPPMTGTADCYCGVKTGTIRDASTTNSNETFTPEWICPPAPCCSDVVDIPAGSDCSATDAKIYCNSQTCKWEYICPVPPVCTCNNIPLPPLDPTVAGCPVDQAKWFCSTTVAVSAEGDVVSITPTGANALPGGVKRQTVDNTSPIISDCAYWDYRCTPTQECVASYDCGFQCYDPSQPRPMIACMPPIDQKSICQQRCLQKYSKCVGYTAGNTFSCQPVTSETDYKSCVASCDGTPPPPADKCSFINDQCNCKQAGCGWCESTLDVTDPVPIASNGESLTRISIGYCASLNSEFQCVASANTFNVDAAVEASKPAPCTIVFPPEPIPLPVDPTLPDIDKCLLDNRCVSPTDVNVVIKDNAAGAADGDVIKTFVIVVTAVISSDKGIVNLAVDVTGDREPLASELPDICKVVANAFSSNLNFNVGRVEVCNLSKVTSNAVKRQSSQTNHYVANMRVANNDGIQGNAIALYPALAAASMVARLL